MCSLPRQKNKGEAGGGGGGWRRTFLARIRCKASQMEYFYIAHKTVEHPPHPPCQNTVLTLLDNRNLCDLKSIAQIK